jgi:2-polyprenyl-6-methoxyphenol hydroxylase-like FAD-dependent oxidoreductase
MGPAFQERKRRGTAAEELTTVGKQIGDRAVVLGGSMAGLLAARVLSDAYAHVTVVDRDELTGVKVPRRGVPHGPHAHGLLARGHEILEELFPGLTEALTSTGVPLGDLNGEIRWYVNGRRLQPEATDLACLSATRPVLEAQVRLGVQAIPNVTLIEQCDILSLVPSADKARITGVRVQRQAADSVEEVLAADLVVDATGRGSRTPAWLDALGYQRAEEEKVKVGLAYTTRHYRLRSDPFHGDLAINPIATPAYPRGAFFSRISNNDIYHAELSLTGVLGDHAPTDPAGFEAFAKSLPVPEIYESIRDAEPLTDPVTFRFPASTRRRYERLTDFPANLLVTGDAVCSFNPVYGQGMTIAGLEAITLREHLRRGVPQPQAFFKDIAAVINSPWDVAAGGDLAFPGVEGRRTLRVRLENAYTARFLAAAAVDAKLTTLFMRVAGLVAPPTTMVRPSTLLRVLRPRRRKSPPPPAPADLSSRRGPTDAAASARQLDEKIDGAA